MKCNGRIPANGHGHIGIGNGHSNSNNNNSYSRPRGCGEEGDPLQITLTQYTHTHQHTHASTHTHSLARCFALSRSYTHSDYTIFACSQQRQQLRQQAAFSFFSSWFVGVAVDVDVACLMASSSSSCVCVCVCLQRSGFIRQMQSNMLRLLGAVGGRRSGNASGVCFGSSTKHSRCARLRAFFASLTFRFRSSLALLFLVIYSFCCFRCRWKNS